MSFRCFMKSEYLDQRSVSVLKSPFSMSSKENQSLWNIVPRENWRVVISWQHEQFTLMLRQNMGVKAPSCFKIICPKPLFNCTNNRQKKRRYIPDLLKRYLGWRKGEHFTQENSRSERVWMGVNRWELRLYDAGLSLVALTCGYFQVSGPTRCSGPVRGASCWGHPGGAVEA